MPEFKQINGHIEVYINGDFIFSADNMQEARQELNTQCNNWLFADLNEVIDMC